MFFLGVEAVIALILTPKGIAILYQNLQLFLFILSLCIMAFLGEIFLALYGALQVPALTEFPMDLWMHYVVYSIVFISRFVLLKKRGAYVSLDVWRKMKWESIPANIFILFSAVIAATASVSGFELFIRTACIPALYYGILSIIIYIAAIMTIRIAILFQRRISSEKYLYDNEEKLSNLLENIES